MAINPVSTSSGLDTKAIVDKLMEYERQPLFKLQKKEASYQSRITSYGALMSALVSFRNTATAMKDATALASAATVTDSTYLTAIASASAATGNYNISINNIASAQSVYSLRFGSQSATIADLSVNATQKLKIQAGSNAAKTITIDSTNNTLTAVKDAINAASAGASASIIKESDKFTIDGTNNTIIYNDGTANRTATIASGTYTGAELATAMQTALNGAPGTANTFSVNYNTTATNKFTITNTAGPQVTVLWGDAGTTSEQILGFSPATSTVAASGSVSSTNAVDGTYKLTITASSTGASNRLVVQTDENNDGTFAGAGETDTSGLSSLAFDATYNAATGAVTGGVTNLTQTQAALDAKLKINGIEVTRSSNTISDLITGVTLTLIKGDSATYGSATHTSVNVAKDNRTITDKLNNFVAAYNKLMGAIATNLGSSTQKGALSGDAVIRSLQGNVSSAMNSSYNSTYLASLGLVRDKTGAMSLNTTKLNDALNSNSSSVMTTINSMASSLESAMKTYEQTILPSRTEGLQKTVKDLQKGQTMLLKRLDNIEAALKRKYTSLDKVLGQLQGTSTYLSQQLDSLGKVK